MRPPLYRRAVVPLLAIGAAAYLLERSNAPAIARTVAEVLP